MTLIFYVVAIGFVSAGLVHAFHCSLMLASTSNAQQSDQQDKHEIPFILSFDTFGDKLWSLMVCIFAGPYILIRYGFGFWREKAISTSVLIGCIAVCLCWSFFSGVVLVELAIYAGLIQV